MTFQGKPDGFFGRVGPLIQSIPGIKTVVPFYNTPTNIINEVFDRTLNWSPLYKGIKGDISGKELDDALAILGISELPNSKRALYLAAHAQLREAKSSDDETFPTVEEIKAARETVKDALEAEAALFGDQS